jgi:hypothetical protein
MTKPLYLTLTNQKKIRVIWNESAEKKFTELVGKEMILFADGSASPSEMLTFAWCAAVEGEAADNRELGLTEKELGRIMNGHTMNDLAILCAGMVFSEN